jgi:hypothetical protein
MIQSLNSYATQVNKSMADTGLPAHHDKAVVLTLHAVIDVSLTVPCFKIGETMRAQEAEEQPAGKGVRFVRAEIAPTLSFRIRPVRLELRCFPAMPFPKYSRPP